MRHKMSIDKDSPVCSLCNCALETLPHIFLECAVTRTFLYLLRKFINSNIDRTYVDPFKYYLITCMHENGQINFINAVAKWYISNRFHNKQSLIWDGFAKQVKMFLQGEKQTITQILRGLFPWLGRFTSSTFSPIIVAPFSIITIVFFHVHLASVCQHSTFVYFVVFCFLGTYFYSTV